MASTINGTSTGSGGLISTGDDSGILNIQTNETTAITVDASQRVAFVAGTAALPAITTAGDTNTGIYFPAADTIAFSEGGTEAMRIDSSGNVGLGTTSPVAMSNNNGLQVGPSGIFQTVVNQQSLFSNNAYYNGSAWKAVRTQSGYTALRMGAIAAGVISFHSDPAAYTANDTLSNMDGSDIRMIITSGGNVLVTSAAGLGYGTGSGGTVTQATNKGTGVTLNKPTGKITTSNAALAGGATVSFSVNSSLCTADDLVLLSVGNGSSYTVTLQFVSGGVFNLRLTNTTGGSLSEAVAINFAIIKGATS